jgi:hypothetical protein
MPLNEGKSLTTTDICAEFAAGYIHSQLRGRTFEDHPVNDTFHNVFIVFSFRVVENDNVLRADVS